MGKFLPQKSNFSLGKSSTVEFHEQFKETKVQIIYEFISRMISDRIKICMPWIAEFKEYLQFLRINPHILNDIL